MATDIYILSYIDREVLEGCKDIEIEVTSNFYDYNLICVYAEDSSSAVY